MQRASPMLARWIFGSFAQRARSLAIADGPPDRMSVSPFPKRNVLIQSVDKQEAISLAGLSQSASVRGYTVGSPTLVGKVSRTKGIPNESLTVFNNGNDRLLQRH